VTEYEKIKNKKKFLDHILFNLKAEALIRDRLNIKETPDLYCSLGEVTRDIQYFEKAIEISKGKSARAYRMLAKYQFSKEKVFFNLNH
jgi:hypothetical protein